MRPNPAGLAGLALLIALWSPYAATAATAATGATGATGVDAAAADRPPMLLGRCTAAQLAEAPYADWFRAAHDDYAPNPGVLDALRVLEAGDVEIAVVFGTWCGDSRREVPRIEKVLDELGLRAARRSLIAVDREPGALKRSPGGEERGHEIYRVPTVLVRRDGIEVGRIVEYPVRSIERDLLAILSGDDYRPNYASYPLVREWLRDGLLADPNVSARGLAGALRPLVEGEGELHAAARVLLDRGQVAEAVALFRVNRELYRDSARCEAALAEALVQSGDEEGARAAAVRALELNRDPERREELLALLGRAYGT